MLHRIPLDGVTSCAGDNLDWLEHEASRTLADAEAPTSDMLGFRLADADSRFDPDMESWNQKAY